jgi:pantoate kinase
MHVGLRGPTAVAHGCVGVGVCVEGRYTVQHSTAPSPTRVASNGRDAIRALAAGHAMLAYLLESVAGSFQRVVFGRLREECLHG